METRDGLKVRVSMSGEGYRDTERTTEIQLESMEREEVSFVHAPALRDSGRFRRPTLIALASLLPMILLLSASDRDALVTALEWAFVAAVALIVWGVTYIDGERVTRRLAEAVDDDAPDAVERTSMTVRPAQSMVLVGGQHREAGGGVRDVKCVRVEESVVEGHKTLLAEYADGGRAVLLADLSEVELAEVCACARAHDLKVL
ncbi:MAG: hypothetical protein AB8H86_03160 [Polyangiales bacterium]